MERIEDVLLRHRAKLLGFIQSRLSDPDLAEDVLQDSLLKAIRSANELKDEEKLLAWFYRILENAVIDTYRHNDVEARYQVAYYQNEALLGGPEDDAAVCDCFREILPSLKPEYGEILEALDLSGGNPDDVAQRLHISANNLKVRRHRARQALRQRLEETCRVCAVHGCLDCTCRSN